MDTEQKTEQSHSERQAWAQVESIVEMVANLTREGAANAFAQQLTRAGCDKLFTQFEIDAPELDGDLSEDDQLAGMREAIANLITREQIDDPEGFEWDEDSARETIQQDALSVEYRSGWVTPGDEMEPEEFSILLCTGGPAVRIRGEIDRGEPSRAWVEHQDWGTPWTQIFGLSDEQQEAILTYCREYIVF